jgi:hypothetical protein
MPEGKTSKSYIAASYGFIGKSYEMLGLDKEAELNYILGINSVEGVREPYVKLIEFLYNKKR